MDPRTLIKQWLEGKMDYSEGMSLLIHYHRNQSIIKVLLRKHKPDKLKYELEKLAAAGTIKESNRFKNPPPLPKIKAKMAAKSPEKVDFLQNRADFEQKPAKKADIPQKPAKTAEKPEDDLKLVILDGRIRYEDLPDDLKATYDEIRTTYKEMRAIHEKMKIAPSDYARRILREALIERDDKVAEGWEKLDSVLK